MAVVSITEQIEDARSLLVVQERPERSLPAIAAALLAAVTSLMLAGAVVLGPGVEAPVSSTTSIQR